MSVENASNSSAALRRRVGYAVAASVAAVGGTVDADAAVVYSGIQDISIGQGQRQALRLNDDTYNDIVLKNYIFANGNYQGGFIPFLPGAVSGFAANGLNYATALNAGEVIDQSTLGGGGFSLALGAANPNAQFNNVESKYIGFAFPIGPQDLYFAWLRVSINNTAGTFVLHDWAWQNETGVPITAGAGGLGDFNVDGVVDGADFLVWQLNFGGDYDEADLADWKSAYGNGTTTAAAVASAVPEPGALGLLAAGAGGVELLRRRRERRSAK